MTACDSIFGGRTGGIITYILSTFGFISLFVILVTVLLLVGFYIFGFVVFYSMSLFVVVFDMVVAVIVSVCFGVSGTGTCAGFNSVIRWAGIMADSSEDILGDVLLSILWFYIGFGGLAVGVLFVTVISIFGGIAKDGINVDVEAGVVYAGLGLGSGIEIGSVTFLCCGGATGRVEGSVSLMGAGVGVAGEGGVGGVDVDGAGLVVELFDNKVELDADDTIIYGATLFY